ncbi:2-hydroxyacid dehydrogenase family protein [Pediococcus inopinatus]|jgi:lactate dehydrogenase-like 2-hydroxyacid dehydrogenase|uniref:2-hydroxyacid dehydrogenase family protein n=1 Tax=Pediococcus inopinatus TaxID=114090 RepID=A0ABZ0Q4E4_9LACO|nr:2-hydroxyacid dehydrogenase family protein [Pediococcus inopinatus]AVL00924.1 hydroxyacid dehydrogenase [Pediococcus inopinatus]KRN62382.1 glyoxylate reductase [Pediococcus inopinatus]WPC16761.1 2-hydroxyacid dehydrogenase family protein [Pediococcus inopinatus]WPC20114.1 2-hydroxyacid dehydrogenase family protein [Pediococcus inopinatus]WPC21819.1 2-hydroxyacid dehydrogenase family protein [Pediococcus inopinatus]
MSQVYLAAQLPTKTTAILKEHQLNYSVYGGDGLISQQELMENVADAQYLITALSTKVDKEIIDHAPKLKLIANFGAGFNNIDTDYAKEKGIVVTNTPLVSTNSVAEVTVGLMLALSHRVVEGDAQMRKEGFPGWAPLYFLGHEIAGKTLGVVGLGNIGQEVARKASALSMNVQYWQPHQKSDPEERSLGVKYVSFDQLVATSDFISINAPQTSANYHQFNQDVFHQMKTDAAIINVGRGPIIDEVSLRDALKNKEIGGAALDVYEHEPKVTPGFQTMKNVILTPHIGNATVEARDAMGKIVADNIVLVNEGQKAKYVVNP